MEDRRKMINSSRGLRKHSVYSLGQRTIRCVSKPILNHFQSFSHELPELKVVVMCQSDKDANNHPEEPNSVEPGLEDNGYFSLNAADTSPCPGTAETKPQVDCGLKSQCHTLVTPEQHLSFNDDPSPSAMNTQLVGGPANVKLETLEGDQEALDTGVSIFESSACQNLHVTLDATTEEVSEVNATEQVFSLAARSLQSSSDFVGSGKRPRHVPVDEEGWELKKEQFLSLVMGHLAENHQTGAFQELNSLMIHVTDQSEGPHGDHWQHPSDFTRRNYFKHVGKPKPVTLKEWQNMKGREYKRFSSVPKSFERNLLP